MTTRMQDPTLEEMREFLREADEYDCEEAIYWYAANHHGGQGSNLYAALSQSDYKPGPLRNGPENAWVYNDLVMQFGGELIDDDRTGFL